MEPTEEPASIESGKSLSTVERCVVTFSVFMESAGMSRAARSRTMGALLRWVVCGDSFSRIVLKEYLPARVQLELARRELRRRVWIRRTLVLVALIVFVWILVNPIVGFCRRHWPHGTSEVLHGLWALVTSPGFGAVGAVIAALVAFRAALHSQAQSASNDRWWETFEWVMENRLETDEFDARSAAQWLSYLKGAASSPGESVIINVLTQEAIRRGQSEA